MAADALSRVMALSWSSVENSFLKQLKAELAKNDHLQTIVQQCLNNTVTDSNYTVKEGLLYWKNKLVLPVDSSLIQQVLQEFHASPIGGHAGITRTMARISAEFYWPNMKTAVHKFITECLICQQAKHMTTLPAGLLQPLPIPTQVWEDVTMDFITDLPLSCGFTAILVVVDRLTKYAHFMPLKPDYSSKSVDEVFMTNIVKLHGIPKSIVSDRDKVFTSKFWQQLFELQGTTLSMSSAYHPQSDGQSEAVNKTLEMYLRCITAEKPKTWAKALNWAEFWYNSSLHTSIGMIPFKAVHGRDPPKLIRYVPNYGDTPDLQLQLIERDQLLQQLKANLQKAQQTMKTQADRKQTDVSLEIGDQVLVKLQPYRQNSVAVRKNQKLGMRYFGPFKIIKS